MRRSILVVAAALLASPTAILAKPRGAEIDCISDRVAPQDAEAIYLVRRDHRAPTEAEAQAMDRLAEGVRSCAKQYGWSEERTSYATIYALGNVIYDGAERDLAAYGIAPGFIARVAADLGER